MRKVLLLVLLTIPIFIIAAIVIATGFNPLQSKMKSGLQVITNDIPVSLFLDGQYLDKTPFINREIRPAVYTLRIQPDDSNLTPYETPITLSRGLLTVVTWQPGPTPETSGGVIYEMEAIKSKEAEVAFTTIPDNAIIRFDNQEQQFTPLNLENIEPGHHEFEITLPSYETQKHTINAIAGQRLNITVKLIKSHGLTLEGQPQSDSQAEATASAKEETSTPSATPTKESLKQAIEESSEEATSGARVKIKATNFYQDGKEVLRVRDAAGVSGKELGFAEVGKEYPYLNETQSGWYKIKFNLQEGWVSSTYAELLE